MAYSNYSFRQVWRVIVVLAFAVGIAALAGSLIGDGLIPAVLQLGVQG
jgi:4-hydroxybenzoate polyprenyltransferase